jgi:hypothetical protein
MHFVTLKYHQDASPTGFYNQYRNLVVTSLKRKGDTVMWQKKQQVLDEDERLSPTFEELILASVLNLINVHLPGHVWNHFLHLNGGGEMDSLMAYRADILDKIPVFLAEIESRLSAPARSDVDPLSR